MADELARLDRLLDEALMLSPDPREAFLASLEAGEPAVAADLRGLLAHAERSRVTQDLAAAVEAATPHVLRAAPQPAPLLGDLVEGERVGPYRILRLLGRGGMAPVYLAERADGGFSQQVALKLVPRDLLSEEALGRFEQERQILATLNHPHIARLFDGGVDDRGRSFIAMEYVDGQPIDRYGEARKLTLAARLGVFAQVADAVHYAHRNLVIHRDIKPSNILVTADGTVKLLDFGIAKLLDASGAGTDAIAPRTQTLFRVLTPGYASPEQVRGGTITTASDVYQLGLLLYEVLTGQRATDTITGKDGGGAVVRAARTPLSDDLWNIVSKALEHDPERRYDSAAALAADLQRYRDGLPVTARNATRRYRLGKFVRRHKLGVAASAIAACVLVAFVAVLSYQAASLRVERDRVRLEAAKAGEIRDFLTDLFNVPLEESNPNPTARDLIDRAAARLETIDARQPLVKAQMMHTLGGLYIRMGQYDRARTFIDEALRVRRQLLGDQHLDTAESLLFMAMVKNALEDHAGAEALVRQAVAIGERTLGPNHWGVAFALTELGTSVLRQKRYDEAVPIFTRAAAIYQRWPSKAMGAPTNSLGLIRAQLGDLQGATRYYREALAINEKRFGAEHPLVQTNRSNLAAALLKLGDAAGAEALLRDVVERRRRMLGADHPDLAFGMALLASAVKANGRAAEAEPLLVDALRIFEKRYPAGHSRLTDTQVALGRLRLDLAKPMDAESPLRHALAAQQQRLGPTHQATLDTRVLLGTSLLAQQRWAEASTELLYAYEHAPPKGALVERTLERLEELSRRRGSLADAAKYQARLAEVRSL